MKNYLIALISLLALSACQREEPAPLPEGLAGEWDLISVICFCPPATLEPGDQTWDFDLQENEITVTGEVPDNTAYVPLPGTYAFSRDMAAGTLTIYDFATSETAIDSIRFDYYFEGEELIIEDQPEVDGPQLRFVR